MFKSHRINTNYRAIRKNKIDMNGAPVFAVDYISSVLAAKMCTNSHKHSMYIRFLC
jgi:hypothetical protein